MRELIISTDIGTDVDDAFAIYIATQIPDFHIRGVYTTCGPVDLRSKIARRLLDAVEYDTIVGTGSKGPAIDKYGSPSLLSGGESWILSDEEKSLPDNYWRIANDGLDSLEEQLLKGPVEVLSIAQLSNLSEVFMRNPDTVKNVEHLYILGGNRDGAEYNFLHDVPSARHVLGLGIPMTVLPVDVCQKHKVSLPELVQIGGSDAREYLGLMSKVWSSCREFVNVRRDVLNNLKELGNHSFGQCVHDVLKMNDPVMDVREIFELLDSLTNMKEVGTKGKPDFASYDIWKWTWSCDDSHLAKMITRSLKECEIPDTTLHDAMMVYAMVHPDAFQFSSMNIDVRETSQLNMTTGKGVKVLSDMDVSGFDSFLWSYLNGKELRGGVWHEPCDSID